jgi:hypothetical protein
VSLQPFWPTLATTPARRSFPTRTRTTDDPASVSGRPPSSGPRVSRVRIAHPLTGALGLSGDIAFDDVQNPAADLSGSDTRNTHRRPPGKGAACQLVVGHFSSSPILS